MEPNVWTSWCSSGGCGGVQWQSYCANGSCVEVSHQGDRVLVRDGKLGDESPVISYLPQQWSALLTRAYYGYPQSVAKTFVGHGYVWVGPNEAQDGIAILQFDGDELDQFIRGVQAGKFQPPPRSAA